MRVARADITHANCGHCGAPLAISGGPILVCQYCGREHRVSAPRPLPHPYPQQPTSQARFPWLALLGVGSVVVALAFGLLVRWLLGSSSQSVERSGVGERPRAAPMPARAGAPDAWLGRAPVFLKSDGEIQNPVGVAGWPNIGYQLTALDGGTGKVLWHAAATSGSHAYADGQSAVLLADPGNRLARYDAHTGSQKWAITLAEAIYDVSFGPSCASIYLSSGKILGIALESGQAGACAPSTPPLAPSLRDALKDYRAVSGDLSIVGSLRADPKPINPDPTRLAVHVSRSGRVLWQAAPTWLEPVWTSDGFARSMVLTPSGVFLFGRHAGDGLSRWLLLDLTTGQISYEKTGATKIESMPYLASSGPMVFVSHDLRLEAYRVMSGELVWSAGSGA